MLAQLRVQIKRSGLKGWRLTLTEAWPLPQPASQARWWPAVREASMENHSLGYRGRFLAYVSDGFSYSPAILVRCRCNQLPSVKCLELHLQGWIWMEFIDYHSTLEVRVKVNVNVVT